MNFIAKGSKHIWLPYTQMQGHLPQLEVEKTKGSKIFLKDGRVLIDGISSWWSVAHGYNHPHIIAAIRKQASKIPHIMLAGFANDATYELAYRLCQFSKMDHVFFSDSGSVAVEVAMKIAWQYHINCGNKNKTKFISFKNSYHGDTSGAMSLADLSSGMHQKFSNILLNNFSFSLPKNQNDLDKLSEFIKKNNKILAGLIIEPIVQCAGGMKFHDAKILAAIHKIAKENSLIFIADECATGFYRTGKKFAYEFAKIKPDILTIGKALTGGTISLAATLTSKEIFKKFLGTSLDLALMHGPTFMGNALACSAANASLDLFEQENYAQKIADDEKFLRLELEKCRSLSCVQDVRVLGLIGAIETNLTWQEMLKLRKYFVDNGVFLRPFSGCIYTMPSLNIKRSELKKIVAAIKNLSKF